MHRVAIGSRPVGQFQQRLLGLGFRSERLDGVYAAVMHPPDRCFADTQSTQPFVAPTRRNHHQLLLGLRNLMATLVRHDVEADSHRELTLAPNIEQRTVQFG